MSNIQKNKVSTASKMRINKGEEHSFNKKNGNKKARTVSKKKKAKAKDKNHKSSKSNFNLKAFFSSEKLRVVLGFLLVFFSIFLLISFISFFLTHDMDDGLYDKNFFTCLSKGDTVENLLGVVGMYFSFLFIKSGFGIASLGFILLFVLWGIRLISGKSKMPLGKITIYTLAIILAVSGALSYPCVVSGKLAESWWLGGEVCQDLLTLLSYKVGKVGVALIVLLYIAIIVVLCGGWTLVKSMKSSSEADNTAINEDTEKDTLQRLLDDNKQSENSSDETDADADDSDTDSGSDERISIFSRIKLWCTNKKTSHPEEESVAQVPENEPSVVAGKSVVEHSDEHTSPSENTSDNRQESHIITSIREELPRQEEQVSTEANFMGEDILIDDTSSDDAAESSVMEKNITTEYSVLEPGDEDGISVIATEDEQQESADEEMTPEKLLEKYGPYDPHLDLPDYTLPTLELLEEHTNAKRSPEQKMLEINANKIRIKKTLEDYKIEIESISAIEGPTVTLYEIKPAPGVRIARIKGLTDDIAMSLSAKGIRIIAPIPGKGTVGIEVANANPQIVPMKVCMASEKFQNSGKMALPIAIGKTISDEVYVFDLAKMPHVLMAGATGQGKSVGLNVVLTSLLYKKHPSELKFVLVDPKKVELTLYSKIERHYLAKLPDSAEAIITDTKKVVKTLTSLCSEMDMRYALLKEAQCRNIIEYNEKFKARRLNPEKGHRFLPYIVLVFDEFADCIMTAGREVEQPIARLAQLARAIGIHLIIATQRPSVNIITGLIKANFPARIAFKVSSKIDSRTILDEQGAENLIGRGDMLISANSETLRIQCAWVDTPEIESICDYIGNQRGYTSALYLPEVAEEEGGTTEQTADDDEYDTCFADAARQVVLTQQGSASFLQRKLKVGFSRAGRIMDQLERDGIVGAQVGSKAREVLYKDIASLEEYLKSKNL